jgi:hypothetical protein
VFRKGSINANAAFAIGTLLFSYKNCILNMGSKFHKRNITCISFPGLTVSNKIIKISEYDKIVGTD